MVSCASDDQEATAMGSLRLADIQTRPTEVVDLTRLTLNEFWQLVPPFEAALQTHMAEWRLDGQPRTARRYTTDHNCPLPTPEDRLLFILNRTTRHWYTWLDHGLLSC
jgi:hypothetical protein